MSNLSVDVSHAELHVMPSDVFFAGRSRDDFGDGIDLAFIDGMHLVEYALRDFMNVERCSAPGAVIVFDDVLPRSQAEAARVQCPGDWTGDVFHITDILRLLRPDLTLMLANTGPTGTLVVTRLDPASTVLRDRYDHIVNVWARDLPVPDRVLNRLGAVPAEQALRALETR